MPLRPSRGLIGLLTIWMLLGVAASLWSSAALWWERFGFLVGAVSVIDVFLVFLVRTPEVTRSLPGRVAVGVESETRLRVVNRSSRHLKFTLFDGIPPRCECEVMPWSGWIRAGEFLDINYPMTLHERGDARFGRTDVLLGSLLGLWGRKVRVGEESSVKVYPNYQPVLSYALLAMSHRQEHTGIVRKNRSGLSRDFHQLRDYQMGDSQSQIDWKASSKRQTMISREFQEQLDQSVILMLDCGRRMRAIDGELTQFDHCLNSMLLLSYIALRQGDQVGILSFGGMERWLPPVKGTQSMTTILNHLYDYETSTFPSDFSEAAERLLRHQRRRSMVVVMTNLRGEDSDEIREPLRRLREKHIVVLASLREGGIEKMLEKEIVGFDDALGYLSAQDYAAERERVLATIQADGIVTIDETARKFPVVLANSYLDTRQNI